MEARSFTNLGFEEKLFKAADKLRKNMDAAEYKHVVLGLIFLKFVSDAFQHRRQLLVRELRSTYSALADNQAAIDRTLEDRDEYAGENVFWVPVESRWSTLQANATQPTIGKLIDDALYQLEQENPTLKGVFTKNYSRPALESRTLTEFINLFSDIDFMEGRHESNESEQDVVGRVYGQNLLAASLNPMAYQNNPGFVRFVRESGLGFHACEAFNRAELEHRHELYTALAQMVWNPNDLLKATA
jgi:type I restriction enzyme M protein